MRYQGNWYVRLDRRKELRTILSSGTPIFQERLDNSRWYTPPDPDFLHKYEFRWAQEVENNHPYGNEFEDKLAMIRWGMPAHEVDYYHRRRSPDWPTPQPIYIVEISQRYD